MVNSVALLCWAAMSLSGTPSVGSTARDLYSIVPTIFCMRVMSCDVGDWEAR